VTVKCRIEAWPLKRVPSEFMVSTDKQSLIARDLELPPDVPYGLYLLKGDVRRLYDQKEVKCFHRSQRKSGSGLGSYLRGQAVSISGFVETLTAPLASVPVSIEVFDSERRLVWSTETPTGSRGDFSVQHTIPDDLPSSFMRRVFVMLTQATWSTLRS